LYPFTPADVSLPPCIVSNGENAALLTLKRRLEPSLKA
jgi:hypothetical protein